MTTEVPAIEIDATVEEADDPTFDEELSAFTTSLSPSVVDYPVEHGRRYHALKAGAYPMPNDESEQERLDMTHLVMTKIIGEKLYLAPIAKEKIQRILDIGTGTGIWAIEMGDQFPQAEVLGNDFSAVQPGWVPPNVKFEVDDVESPWTYSRPFDFIFCRYMASSIADWSKLTKNIYDNLAPGSFAEFQDYDMRYHSEDGSLTEEHATKKWIDALLDAAAKTGREPLVGPNLREWVEAAGFENVTEQIFKLPIGPWPLDPKLKEVGMINLIQILDGLEAFSLRLMCDVAGWQEDEVRVLLAGVRKELKGRTIHAQIKFHVVYGQKPV